jgi:hypothetical protein
MATRRPGKKAESAPAEHRVLPMELKLGDRLTDETGEYEVIGRPYTTAGGKQRTFVSREPGPTSRWSESGARTSASP